MNTQKEEWMNMHIRFFAVLTLTLFCQFHISTIVATASCGLTLTEQEQRDLSIAEANRDDYQESARARAAIALATSQLGLAYSCGTANPVTGIISFCGIAGACLWLEEINKELCKGGCGRLLSPPSHETSHISRCDNIAHPGEAWWNCYGDESCPHIDDHVTGYECYGPCTEKFTTRHAAEYTHMVDCSDEPCASFSNPEDNNYYDCPTVPQDCPNSDSHHVACEGGCGMTGPKEYVGPFWSKKLVTIDAHRTTCSESIYVFGWGTTPCGGKYHNCNGQTSSACPKVLEHY